MHRACGLCEKPSCSVLRSKEGGAQWESQDAVMGQAHMLALLWPFFCSVLKTSWQGQHSHQVRALLLTWQVGPWGGAPGRWGPGAGHLAGVGATGHLTRCHTLLSLCRGCHFCVSPEHGQNPWIIVLQSLKKRSMRKKAKVILDLGVQSHQWEANSHPQASDVLRRSFWWEGQ